MKQDTLFSARPVFLWAAVVCGLQGSAALATTGTDATRCTALVGSRLPQARVHSAQWVSAGDALPLWSGGPPQRMAKSFCRVRGNASPQVGSSIGFELWLPGAKAWNGKYLQAGNGGTAGAIPLMALRDGVARGYATAATDGGHRWPDGLDYGWAEGRPEAVVDFGWRAVERTARAAQGLTTAAMGRSPKHAYFMGCSDGGRDAMMAAQRLPRAFDGIVAGAPALAWLDMMISHALLLRDTAPPASVLPVTKLPALQAAALAACGHGKPYVEHPPACRFDPALLACPVGTDHAQCLTPPQVEVVRRVYRGPQDPSNGRTLPGLSPGAEADPGNWDFWLLLEPTNPLGDNTRRPTSIGESFFRHLVRDGAAFSVSELTTADVHAARQRWQADLDATNPDLRAFRQRGGKLIHYHGWTDAAIAPGISLDYFHAVQQRMGPTDGFYRLFMVPGMNHCAGGQGPWQADWLTLLERWVEEGHAPDQVTLSHPNGAHSQTVRRHPVPPPTATR